MAEWLPEIPVLGTCNTVEKWVKRQVEQGFSSFFDIFDDFSKWSMPKTHFGTLKNHQIWQKFGKKIEEERPCGTFLQLIFRLLSGSTRSNTMLYFKSSFQP